MARDGRRFEAPIVIAADGVHSVDRAAAGSQSGLAGASVALDMMEETPRDALRDVDPSTLWVAYGYRSPRAAPRTGARRSDGAAQAPRAMRTSFRSAITSTSASATCSQHYRRSIDDAPYELQRGFVDHLRRRGDLEGESVRANFTPFHHPGRRSAARGPGVGRVLLAGDAGGFVNGFTAEGIYYAMVSGDLAARRGRRSDAGGRRRWRDAVRARLRSRNRRGAARFGPDPALPVRRSPADCAGHRGQPSGHRAMTRLILDFAVRPAAATVSCGGGSLRASPLLAAR